MWDRYKNPEKISGKSMRKKPVTSIPIPGSIQILIPSDSGPRKCSRKSMENRKYSNFSQKIIRLSVVLLILLATRYSFAPIRVPKLPQPSRPFTCTLQIYKLLRYLGRNIIFWVCQFSCRYCIKNWSGRSVLIDSPQFLSKGIGRYSLPMFWQETRSPYKYDISFKNT